MPVDSGILTTLLQAFMAVYSSGIGNITPDAERFLFLLGGIELATAALFWALGGDDFFVELFKKILVIGFFAWFVLNWPYFINQIGQGFVDIGFKAGGGKAALADFNDPSSIIDIGFKAVSPIDAKIQTLSFTDVGPYIIYGWSMISILTAFAILAIQVFITQLEFYLLTCLALALVPFGINRWTAFMSEKAFGLVFSFGVKMMVLAFLISASNPILSQLIVPDNPSYAQCFYVLIGAAAIAALAWHAPGLAAGLVSGGPSLSASVAARTALGGGLAALAGIGAGGAAINAGKNATLEATKGLGAVAAGAQFGSATAAMGGGGVASQAIGGMRGAGAVVANTAMSPVGAVASALKTAWSSGQVKGFQSMGLPANNIAQTTPPYSAKQGMSDMANMAMKASHAVPADAHPSGGASPNFKH